MIVLAIETSTLEVGAAIVGDERLLAVERSRPGRLHAETLHPAIADVLSSAGVSPRDLGGVAVDVGPGLFTGVRVGIAAAKAFGFALSLPLVAVRSVEALRHDAEPARPKADAIVPVVDMRRGDVAWELPGGPLEIGPPALLAQRLTSLEGGVFLVGDGARRFEDALIESVPTGAMLHFGGEELAAPSVTGVGAIGLARIAIGATTDALGIEAVYLRAADAQVNFATRDSVAGRGAR